jgi:hypothetical protein
VRKENRKEDAATEVDEEEIDDEEQEMKGGRVTAMSMSMSSRRCRRLKVDEVAKEKKVEVSSSAVR